MKPISKEINFTSKRNIPSISDYKKCLELFSLNFEKEISLATNTPIFLDTNVLLRYYSISFTARDKLFDFIKDNGKRIVLSSQVQLEFTKNREDVIQRFFEQVTNRIPKDFNSDLMNKMNNFIEQHKVVLKDYPFVEAGIKKNKEDLEKLLQQLNETSEQKKKEHINLLTNDKFLDLLSTCFSCDSLSNDELDIIKKDFDTLGKNISPENIELVFNKPYGSFPGMGDIKNKPEDPYGDFIIFHEMMKYMLNGKTDLIFLTFDNTKGDWMTKSKSPYIHYIQNMYANTGQILYIIDAERTFEELLNINIESLVSTVSPNINRITADALQNLIRSYQPFLGYVEGIVNDNHVRELNLNGYVDLEKVKNDLEKSGISAVRYNRDLRMSNLNSVGLLRAALRISNPNYLMAIGHDGVVNNIPKEKLEEYAVYRYM